jgi:hypothetical protein
MFVACFQGISRGDEGVCMTFIFSIWDWLTSLIATEERGIIDLRWVGTPFYLIGLIRGEG